MKVVLWFSDKEPTYEEKAKAIKFFGPVTIVTHMESSYMAGLDDDLAQRVLDSLFYKRHAMVTQSPCSDHRAIAMASDRDVPVYRYENGEFCK